MDTLKTIFWVVAVFFFLFVSGWFEGEKKIHGTWQATKNLIKYSFITLGILIGASVVILLSIWLYYLATDWWEGVTELTKLRYGLFCGFLAIAGYILRLEMKIDTLLNRR